MKETFLWVEKYRPKSIHDCVLSKSHKKTFSEFVKNGIPNLLLTGGPGVGKTTVAKAMLDEIGYDYILINGSVPDNLIKYLKFLSLNFFLFIFLIYFK